MAIMEKVAVLGLLLALVIGNDVVGSNALAVCGLKSDGYHACKPAASRKNAKNPSPACCAALAKANMKCLCGYKDSSMVSIMGIDSKAAYKLPRKCNLPPPPC